ncbi:MAG TPA: large conductance mechanosensitive channel protein MscL [Rhodothermales bacterium]|nr:large conductance mechanosensitive channel protein MscL [Rhodothermales bacterium]
MSMMSEFKEFIAKGNVMDLAVGVIIGAAFQKIVDSLVNDLLMPIVGIFLGGVDFSALEYTVGSATLKYGMFIQAVINFVVIAFVVFLIVRWVNKVRNK